MRAMRFEKYTPQHFPLLAAAASRVNLEALQRQDFVDYYYCDQPWSELHLALDAEDQCAAFIGFDRLRFDNQGQDLVIGMGTNFYSLRPGVGGFLWLHWMKSCSAGMLFGGNQNSHAIPKKQKNFVYYPGVNVYTLNAKYSTYEGEAVWRVALKSLLRTATKKQLSDYATDSFERDSAAIGVQEIPSSEADPIEASCFSFRFAPSAEYLRWRYRSKLSFVRYRWFNILENGLRIGYCVLNDSRERIIVSHSDGLDPEKLALGTLKAIFLSASKDTGKRTVMLSSSHPIMQAIFIRHGFILDAPDRPMAIGSLRSMITLPAPESWLINFGLGDNDLRPSTFLTPKEGIANSVRVAVES
jgi:hypothetical protein